MSERDDEMATEQAPSTLFHFVLAQPDEGEDDEDENNKDTVLWDHRIERGRCPHCGNLTHIRCNGGAEASSGWTVLVPRNAPPFVKRGVCTHPDCQPEQRFVPCYFTRSKSKHNSIDGCSSISNSDSPLAAVGEWRREMREKYKQLKKAKSVKGENGKKSLAWLFEDVLTQLSRAVSDCATRHSCDNCDKQELLENLEDMEMQLDGGRSLLDELQREIGEDLSAGKTAIQRLMQGESGTGDDSEPGEAQADDEQERQEEVILDDSAHLVSQQQDLSHFKKAMELLVHCESGTVNDFELEECEADEQEKKKEAGLAHVGSHQQNLSPYTMALQKLMQCESGRGDDSEREKGQADDEQDRKEEAGCKDWAKLDSHSQENTPCTITPIRSEKALGGGAEQEDASTADSIMERKMRWEERSQRLKRRSHRTQDDPDLDACTDAGQRHSTMPLENANSTTEPLVLVHAQDPENRSNPPTSMHSLETACEINDDSIVSASAIVLDHVGQDALIRAQQSQIRFLRERVEKLDQGHVVGLAEIAKLLQRAASHDGGSDRESFEISTESSLPTLHSRTKNNAAALRSHNPKKQTEVKAMAKNMKTRKGIYSGEIILERRAFSLKSSSLRHGTGTMTYKAGDTYVGEWYQDKRHGKGIYKTPDGKEYVGEWGKDYANGNGVMKYPDGSVYTGSFKNHKRHGKGVLKKLDGSCFDCEWFDDTQHGEGKYTSHNGRQYDVLYRDGRLVKKT